jgi:hypothetical protein
VALAFQQRKFEEVGGRASKRIESVWHLRKLLVVDRRAREVSQYDPRFQFGMRGRPFAPEDWRMYKSLRPFVGKGRSENYAPITSSQALRTTYQPQVTSLMSIFARDGWRDFAVGKYRKKTIGKAAPKL